MYVCRERNSVPSSLSAGMMELYLLLQYDRSHINCDTKREYSKLLRKRKKSKP